MPLYHRSMSDSSTQKLRAAIEAVHDPIFDRAISQLGTLDDFRLEGKDLHLKIRVSSPTSTTQSEFRTRLEAAVASIDESLAVHVEWAVVVPTRETTSTDPIPDVRNVILVLSGKGGVGKSTVATNLALALRRAGSRVGLLDADIYGPSIPTMMGISGHPGTTENKRIVPLQRFGIKLMSIGFLLEDPKQAVVWRGPMLHGALKQFVTDVEWGPLDYLILDLPPGTGDVALSLANQCKLTGCLMVTTPQEVALQDVYKAVNMCGKLDIPMLGVVENMSYFVDPAGIKHELFGSGGGATVAEFAKAPLLGQIPIDPLVRQWGDDGTPVVQAAPESPSGEVFMDIADALGARIALQHFERQGGEAAPKESGPKRLRIVT